MRPRRFPRGADRLQDAPPAGTPVLALFAWIATGPDGREGLVAVEGPGGGMVPLAGSNEVALRSYTERVRQGMEGSDTTARLVRFDLAATLDAH